MLSFIIEPETLLYTIVFHKKFHLTKFVSKEKTFLNFLVSLQYLLNLKSFKNTFYKRNTKL